MEPQLRGGELNKYQEGKGGVGRMSQAESPTVKEFAKYRETTNLRFLCFVKWMRTDATAEESEKFRARFLELLKKHNVKLIFWGNAIGVPEDSVYAMEAPDTRTYIRFWQELNQFRPRMLDYWRTITVT